MGLIPEPLASMQGADAEYARRILQGGPGTLETYTLQARTRRTRDAFALAASHGHLHSGALLSRLAYEQSRPSISKQSPKQYFDPRALVSLARITASQAATAEEHYEAVGIYKKVLTWWSSDILGRQDRLVFLESLAWLGFRRDVEKYGRILKIARFDRNQMDLLLANAIKRGGRVGQSSLSDEWLNHANAMYRRDRIETFSFAPGSGALFDRILSGPAEHVMEGPLVTVIVPTFDSGTRIDTALRSIVNQTWRRLEILVMDDNSPDDNDPYLTAWALRDPRIRVHKMPSNGGTYRARNFAVKYLATGDLVTVHDDDDWSHPRKIQTQVEHLLANPDEPANMSLLSRATDDLLFARINNNPIFSQPNYSSLMFWRERVIRDIGYWDLVNRSADAEFIDRLKSYYGRAVSTAGTSALSFLRVREGSLTAGEISRGYI